MATSVAIAAVFALIVGAAVLFANSERFTNQIFAVMALIVALRSFFIYQAIQAGNDDGYYLGTNPVVMLRAAVAVSMFLPWALWILKESLVNIENGRMRMLARSLPLLALNVGLAIVCETHFYYNYSEEPLPLGEQHGAAYVPVNCFIGAEYLWLIGQSWYQLRLQSGIRRLELQILVLNYAIGAFATIGLAVSSHWLVSPAPRQLSHLVIIAGCAFTAWSVSYKRVFNIKQVMTALLQRAGLLCFLCLSIYWSNRALEVLVFPSLAFLVSVATCCSLAVWLDRWSRAWLGIDGERALATMRQAVIALARTEPNWDVLGSKFESFLCQQCSTSFAALLPADVGEGLAAGKLDLVRDRAGYAVLCTEGWATPESLERRRPSAALSDLRDYLAEHSLGLVVAVPRGSPSPSLLIALGTKANEWPFTYPEVVRLQNIAELMDNILTHSRLSMQAAIRAKLEHLAMMSRGLAHDLNNLITPVSSFLVYAEERFPPEGPEREVHEAARRSVRVMQDYVREALFFAERLTPRFEAVDLRALFAEVSGLMAARAAERGVTLTWTTDAPVSIDADAVLLQRVLTNLVSNAIDASNRGQTVHLTAARGRMGWVCLRVADEGSGVASEHLQRIFDPYFTTKKYGDEVRGFGLGLTICQKIVHLHNGTISVASQPGRGTTMTVDLPVVQKGNRHPMTAGPLNVPPPVLTHSPQRI